MLVLKITGYFMGQPVDLTVREQADDSVPTAPSTSTPEPKPEPASAPPAQPTQPPPAAPAGEWIKVADEPHSFEVPPGASVGRFGNDSVGWVERAVWGGMYCDEATFGNPGNDGTPRRCEVRSGALPPAAPTPPSPPSPAPQPPVPPSAAGGNLDGIAPGRVRELQPFGATSESVARVDYAGLVVDAVRRRVYLFGGGHGPAQYTNLYQLLLESGTWYDDGSGLTQAQRDADTIDHEWGRWAKGMQPYAMHTYNGALLVGDEWCFMTPYEGPPVFFNLVTKTWRWSQTIPAQDSSLGPRRLTPWYYGSTATLDPISGKVIIIGPVGQSGWTGVWEFDVAADTFRAMPMAASSAAGVFEIQYSFSTIYLPDRDVFRSIKATGVILDFGIDRKTGEGVFTKIQSEHVLPDVGANADGFDLEPSRNVIAGNVIGGKVTVLDLDANTFSLEQLYYEDGRSFDDTQQFHALKRDPVSGCFIMLSRGRTYAFRLPGAGAPGPSPAPQPDPAPSPSIDSVVVTFAPHGSAALRTSVLHKRIADDHAVYRSPINKHLTAWFEVRGGDVLAWVENGYLLQTDKRSYAGTMTLAIDGVVRASHEVDLPAHARAPFWPQRIAGGESPLSAVEVKWPLVPPVGVKASEALLARTLPEYQPLMRGSYPVSMGTAGYDPSIGLLPEWDMTYLASKDPRALRSVVQHTLAAGRYGIHYRDEVTHDMPEFAGYPNLSNNASTKEQIVPASTGTQAPTWRISHHPSIGYLAYLLTGWEYFADEVRFAAVFNHFCQVDWQREFGAGILHSHVGANTTRGAGWALRTLMQAAIVAGSDSQYAKALRANIEHYHAKYVAKPNCPQGFVRPYSDYTGPDGEYHEAIWMQDFVTAAMGWMLANDPGNERLRELFEWKARSIVGRLGDPADPDAACYQDAAQYEMSVAPSDAADWDAGTGPWYATWRAIWDAATDREYGRTDDGVLRGTSASLPGLADGYWANLMPAITMAVMNDAPGAEAAFKRLASSKNWQSFLNAFANAPVWAVLPPTQAN